MGLEEKFYLRRSRGWRSGRSCSSLHHWLRLGLCISGVFFSHSFHKLWAVAFVLSCCHQPPCRNCRDDGEDCQENSHDTHNLCRHLHWKIETNADSNLEQFILSAATAELNKKSSQLSAIHTPLMIEGPTRMHAAVTDTLQPRVLDSFLILR
jgi:hypothetical protein